MRFWRVSFNRGVALNTNQIVLTVELFKTHVVLLVFLAGLAERRNHFDKVHGTLLVPKLFKSESSRYSYRANLPQNVSVSLLFRFALLP